MNSVPSLERPTLSGPTLVAAPPRAARPGFLRRALSWLFGWAWRVLIGTFFCLNPLGAVIVLGWLYRRVAGRVLYGWWKQARRDDTFAEFLRTLGTAAPALRPRWFLQEKSATTPASFLRRLLYILRYPIASLWLNLRTGVAALLPTALATGFGSLLMAFSWWYGWLNSFHKGYENAAIGPVTGLLGVVLFTAAMFYVPMAQVHQAVTGEIRAFFDFRFIWQLIRSRLTGYLGLALLFLFFGVVLEVLKTLPVFLPQFDLGSEATDEEWTEAARFLQQFYFWSALVLFVALLLTRRAAARVYRLAVLQALRTRRIQRADLRPQLANWLEQLGLLDEPPPTATGVWRAMGRASRWTYHRFLYVALALVWILFAAKGYMGEFLNVHPSTGFLNQPLIQLPFFNSLPADLQELVDRK